MTELPEDISDPNAALERAWADVESGDTSRIAEAVASLPELIPVIVSLHGESSSTHRSALRALAYGLDEVGDRASSREMYTMLAELIAELRSDSSADDDDRDEQDASEIGAGLLDEELYAAALGALIGANELQSKEALSTLDGLVAKSEASLGPTHRRTLWLLARRAQWMVRVNGEAGLTGFELLVARAALIAEGGVEHLGALADQATELSRLDLDAESALLWERVTAGRRHLYGLEHRETLAAWWWLVRTLTWSGDIKRADGELSQLIPALSRILGEDHAETLTAMRFRVQLLRQLRAHGEDEPEDTDPRALARQILTSETARFGPDSLEVFRTRDVLIEIEREQWEPGQEHERLRSDAQTLILDAATELGIFADASIQARHTAQRLLRSLSDGLLELDPAVPTEIDAVTAEGLQGAHDWRILVSEHCRELRSADSVDDEQLAQFVEELRGALQAEAGWHAFGREERLSVLRDGATELASFGVVATSAEIRIRDALARELFDTERADESLEQYERVLKLERDRAALSNAPDDIVTRIALSVQAVGSALRRLGRTEEAEAVLDAGIQEARSAGVAESVIGDLRNARALALQELDRYDEAAVEMRALVESSDDVGYVIDLAVVYLNAGRPAEAEAVLTPALDRLEATGAGKSVQAMRIMGNLALAACKRDRDAEAAAAYDRLYEMQLASIGPTHRDTLITMNNRALEEQHLGRFAEATRRFEQVYELRAEALGERDPQTLSSLANLAQSSQSAGDLDASRRHSETVVRLSREVLGAHHPSTLTRTRVLDRTLELLGASSEERASLASEVSAGFAPTAQRDGDGRSPGLSALLFADHLADQGRHVDALVEFTRARDAFAADADVNWLRAERGIAASHRALNAFQEASESYARIIPQLERLLPEDRWALADALNNLSLSLSRVHRVDEVDAPQRRAISIADTEGSNAERAVLFRVWLGRRLAANGQHDAALSAYEEAVSAGERLLDTDHKITLDARGDIAGELLALGRGREALKIYRKNIPAMARAFGADSSQVTRAREKQQTAAQGASKTTTPWVLGVIAAVVISIVLWNEFGG